MTPAESAARLLLHLLTLRGIHMTDIPAAIDAGHLTERDWCLTVELIRGWEEGRAVATRRTTRMERDQRWNEKRRAMRQGVAA